MQNILEFSFRLVKNVYITSKLSKRLLLQKSMQVFLFNAWYLSDPVIILQTRQCQQIVMPLLQKVLDTNSHFRQSPAWTATILDQTNIPNEYEHAYMPKLQVYLYDPGPTCGGILIDHLATSVAMRFLLCGFWMGRSRVLIPVGPQWK